MPLSTCIDTFVNSEACYWNHTEKYQTLFQNQSKATVNTRSPEKFLYLQGRCGHFWPFIWKTV